MKHCQLSGREHQVRLQTQLACRKDLGLAQSCAV